MCSKLQQVHERNRKGPFSLIIALVRRSLFKSMSSRSQKILALVGLIVTLFGGISLFNDSFILGISALGVSTSIGIIGAVSVLFGSA